MPAFQHGLAAATTLTAGFEQLTQMTQTRIGGGLDRDGAGVREVVTAYRRAGVREVSLRLYPGARHELLNETNREQVTADLLVWVGAHV